MNTNFDFHALKNRTKWKRAWAFFLSLAMLLTVITMPDSPLHGPMTAYASASGDADSVKDIKETYSKQAQGFTAAREGEDTRGDYYKQSTFPISYLEQEQIHTITEEGNLGSVNSITWYQFTPQETLLYRFSGNSIDEEYIDSYGSIYIKNDAQGCYQMVASDDESNGNGHFKITETLQAGTTYYLCAGYFSSFSTEEYEISFSRGYLINAAAKINGFAKNTLTTMLNKSYTLEADITYLSATNPIYEWYTLDDTGNKLPLQATGNKYTYKESGTSATSTTIYCTVTANTDSETLSFHLQYYPLKMKLFVDGNDTHYFQYQMGRAYKLRADAVSDTVSPLTYTWKLDEKILQTGTRSDLVFTPTEELTTENRDFYIICEVSNAKGNNISSSVNFQHTPIMDIKREINGNPCSSHNGIFCDVPYTLKINATEENGKPLTYKWRTSNGTVIGNGQTFQYTLKSPKTSEKIYCVISNGSTSVKYLFYFYYRNSPISSLTVNGSSASGNAIPIQLGKIYQLKVSAEAEQGKTLSYEWGTWDDNYEVFSVIPGQTADTFNCNITKAEDIIPRLICRISDSDGNITEQRCYMDYWSIYNINPFINGIPCQSMLSKVGQKYTLAVKTSSNVEKTLTYSWYSEQDGVKKELSNKSTFTYTMPEKNQDGRVICLISDGKRSHELEFYMPPINPAYDFTINGVSTNMAYAYEGKKITLNLKDIYGMAGDIVWAWDSANSTSYKNQITITMGKTILKGECFWDDSSISFTLLPCTDHAYTSKITKAATTSAKGVFTDTCKKCGHTRTTSIAKVSTVKLSKTSFDYNGKNQKTVLTVKDSAGKTLKPGKDYDYTYSNKKNGKITAKNIGQYTVKITFKGSYRGSKNLTFKILPKKVTLSKLSAIRKGFKAAWKKPTNKTTGYEISYALNKSFQKKPKTLSIKNYRTTSKTVKKLKAKTAYYVRIRTYKTVKSGKKTIKLYSNWSSPRKVKTKK